MIELPLVSIHHRGQETMISYNLLLSDADPACTLLLSDSLENCPHSPLSPVVSQVTCPVPGCSQHQVATWVDQGPTMAPLGSQALPAYFPHLGMVTGAGQGETKISQPGTQLGMVVVEEGNIQQ